MAAASFGDVDRGALCHALRTEAMTAVSAGTVGDDKKIPGGQAHRGFRKELRSALTAERSSTCASLYQRAR